MNNFAPWIAPERDESGSDRVRFSIKRNGVSVSATVPAPYFDEHVLPVVSSLLSEIGGPSAGCGPSVEADRTESAEIPVLAERPPMSVKTIAQKLCARTAPQILRAAAISLQVLQGKQQFSREELLAEAQLAHGFWRKTHSESAHPVLSCLLAAGTLIETFDGRYTLSADEEAAAAALLV